MRQLLWCLAEDVCSDVGSVALMHHHLWHVLQRVGRCHHRAVWAQVVLQMTCKRASEWAWACVHVVSG